MRRRRKKIFRYTRDSSPWIAVVSLVGLMIVLAARPKYGPLVFDFQNASCNLGISTKTVFLSFTKLPHIFGFALLYFLLARCFVPAVRVYRAALLTLAVSLAIEVEQLYIPTRHCEITDMIPNLAGIFIGYTLAKRYL